MLEFLLVGLLAKGGASWRVESLWRIIPKGKSIYGAVRVGEKGQLVIPKEACEPFGIQSGMRCALGDERW